MNNRGQKAKHTIARHLEALRLLRYRKIVRTIPARSLLTPREHLRYRIYAAMAVDLLGRKGLARVVWPWQERPPVASSPVKKIGRARRQLARELRDSGRSASRGRASNPTALR